MIKASYRGFIIFTTFVGLFSLVYIVPFSLLWSNKAGESSGQKLQPVPEEIYKLISPYTYKYILDQPAKCKDGRPFLVITVPVAPANRASRDAIRRTWGKKDLISGVEILCIFFVGLPSTEDSTQIQKNLESESQVHRDIVQINFLDSYLNLTIKTMMMMNWLASNCQGASYAMKIDADIFLNVDYLVNKLLDPSSDHVKRNFITGSVIKDGRPRRNNRSKWWMPKDVYPEDSYPPYVSGAAYVFSIDLAEKISWASRFVRPVPLEDVYVGLCLRVLGVQPVYSFSFTSMTNLFEIRHIKYERCTYFRRVIVTGFQPEQLTRIWHDFQWAKYTC